MPSLKLLFGTAIWIGLLVAGFAWLMLYESRPGREAAGSAAWPEGSQLARDSDRATLVLFLHPHCPCSRASLHELEELIAGHPGRLSVFIVFCRPEGVADGWQDSATWRQAMALGAASTLWDSEDCERRVFAAQTSGQVFLYDDEGRLSYAGGITRARGQTGAAAGRSAIEAVLRGEEPACGRGPVFGCPLVDADVDEP